MTLIYISGKNPSWLADSCADYCNRVRNPWRLQQMALPVSKKHNTDTARAVDEESQALVRASKSATRVVFDTTGKQMDSLMFANFVNDCSAQQPIAFLIGGPSGVSNQLRKITPLCISLSSMTWPHALARLMVCEQIYRASTIIFGGSYHK